MPLLDAKRQWQSWPALEKAPAAGGADSAEMTQFLARISAPSGPRKAAYAALVDGLVADGLWTKTDVLHIQAAADSATSLINLKSSSYPLVNHGASFAADAGWLGNGTSAWMDFGYDPNAVGSANFKNDGSEGTLIVYITNTPSTGFTYALHSAGNVSFIAPWFAGDVYCSIGGGGINGSAGGTGKGQILFTRTGSAVNLTSYYKNGSVIVGSTGAVSVGGSTGNIALFATSGGGGNFSDARISASAVVGALNNTQALAYMSRINAYMSALGINAY